MEGGFNHRSRTAFTTSVTTISKSKPPSPESKIFMRGFSTYCQQTSLHGWQYIDSENGLSRKIVWFLIVLVFSATSIGKI